MPADSRPEPGPQKTQPNAVPTALDAAS
jgi:hypothetical protein